METDVKSKNYFEGTKRFLIEVSPKELEMNMLLCMATILEECEKKEYIVEFGGKEVKLDSSLLNEILPDEYNFDKLSRTRRKKFARRISACMHKHSLKSINSFFYFLSERMLEGKMSRIRVKQSKLEQEIISIQKDYKELKMKVEKMRLHFKEKKKLFYK